MNKIFDISEACKMTNLSEGTLRRLLRERRIACFRIGIGRERKRIRFAREHLEQFLESVEQRVRGTRD